jgi:hypothetical protein
MKYIGFPRPSYPLAATIEPVYQLNCNIMTTKKQPEKPTSNSDTQENSAQKTKNPLVFISHDTRDSDLAEEFSNLLRSASAGALKSFRSSDKKGTQGIEYGQEWYPAIMDKIDEASDVVCLLTQHSVDRPWILYEAGVAKGKLNKKVIGIALGIPLGKAISGPFAQFQNNDGDVDSITKLVLELVRKVPGLDPDQTLVKTLVEMFVKRVEEISEQIKAQQAESPQTIKVEDNSVAKLFEEVKIMFDSLPSRMDNRYSGDPRKRRRKFHPMMMEEVMHLGNFSEDPYVGFLIALSMFKEDLPWFYEIGLETYRDIKKAKSISERKKLYYRFENLTEIISHPIIREMNGDSEDMYFMYKESRHILTDILHRITMEDKM